MTKITKKIVSLIFGAIAFIAFSFGLVFTMPQMKTAKAADTAVTFTAAYLEGNNNELEGYLQIRMDATGVAWASANRKNVGELPSTVVDKTTVNGFTLTELEEKCTSNLPIIVTLQSPGSFSFMRIWIPLDFMTIDGVRSFGVLDGWAYNDGATNYTSSAITYVRENNAMVNLASCSDTKLTADDITIGDAQLVHRNPNSSRAADSYIVEIKIDGLTCADEYAAMYSGYDYLRKAIYINGKPIEDWNAQLIAEDARFNDPSTYTYFPQNSTDPSHKTAFVKPIGLWWVASTGTLRLSIFQELVASLETVEVTIGVGCSKSGSFMVTENVSKTVLTQNVVDITDMLTFLDNTHNDNNNNTTNAYFIYTNNTTCWTKAPWGGCLNEYDASPTDGSKQDGGQIQMKYVTFNGTSLYDINKNDNGSYGSTQGNIASGGQYAPILVTMTTELGSSLKLHVPMTFTNGKDGHEEIVIKKGFNVKEGNTSYYVSNDVVFTNNGTAWTKEVKPIEIETEVTGIVTKANRTDGGTNENFVIFQLSNNDYAGLDTKEITDISSLYGYIDIGGTVIDTYSGQKFFNVWGITNSVAFRFGDPATLQNISYITIKAGAKFPSYNTQYNGAPLTYFVTEEDITFVHDIPNDTWTVGAQPAATHTVTFTVDGATYHTEAVENGATVSAPEAPTKAEDENYTYTFKQWTLNGVAYDFATPVEENITLVAEFTKTAKGAIDITSEIDFIHQAEQFAGTETYMFRTENNYWTSAAMQGGCLNEYDPESAGGGQEQLKYIYFNGTSLYDINKNDHGSYGSSQGNIASGGQYAPFLATVGSDNGQYSYIQIHIPTLFAGVGVEAGETANENHKSFEIKAGLSLTENDTTWTVRQDLKWINLNGTWVNVNDTFSADTVEIRNVRVDGVANELYKVDIVSESWNITCNHYDWMYGGNYPTYRKSILINGVSVYDINANTDDSGYVYSTSPMTGNNDELFAHPVLIYVGVNQGAGDPHLITLWIHKNYIDSLKGEITVTLPAGYSAYTNGLVLAEDVNYKIRSAVEVDDGTDISMEYVIENVTTVASLGTPTKATTATTVYTFEGWYDANTDTKLDAATVITSAMRLEARYTEKAVNFINTDIQYATYYVDEENLANRWLYFTLTNHDFPTDVATYNLGSLISDASDANGGAGVDYAKSIGLFDKIIVRGSIPLGNTIVSEATLAQIGAANGSYGEAVYMNIWDATKYYATIAFRTIGFTSDEHYITEVIVEEGALFPSYEYVSACIAGNKPEVETYLMLPRTVTATNNNANGLDGSFLPEKTSEYDIKMAEGASVRITSNMDTSGVRFETIVSGETLDELYALVDKGDYDTMTLGTLIVPKDYLMGGFFTHEWLKSNGFNYLDIESTAYADDEGKFFPKQEGDYYSYFGSIVKLKESNYNREFVGVGYIALWKNDVIDTYIYAEYDPTNARAASFIANAAINDRSATQTEDYSEYIEENNNYSPYTESENTFLKNYLTQKGDSAINSQDLTALDSKGGTVTVDYGVKLNGAYVELHYQTNVNVWGVFTYTDGSKTANEDFYLQAGTTVHKQYLDLFRVNGVGYGMNASNLTMTSITFTNAELNNTKTGEVKILALYSYAETVETGNQEVYVTVAQEDGSEMTVGAHLGLGGSLTYLAKSGIYEGRTSSVLGSVKISTSTSTFSGSNYYGNATSSKAADYAVNLINNWDAGRQIQQSWYAQVGGSDKATADENGYTRAYCYTESTAGKFWPYNPVQAGDVVSNPSQIIDYEVNEAKGYIYVKARAMDWAKGDTSCANSVEGGSTTKSYMENYYRLNADGTVVVNNSFIDWNGFTDMRSCDWASTELPAVYPVHTLNYYVSNVDGDGTWTDALEYDNDVDSWVGGGVRQGDGTDNTKVENWFAWANGGDGNAIGLGMYIPNVYRFTSGRSDTSISYSTSVNRNSNSNVLLEKGLMSNMQPIKYAYQSAYVSNTSYTAPGISYRMEAYVPIEYTYVLCVNTVSNIRSTFKAIEESGKVTNAGNGYEKVGLDAWARQDKSWTW